jgi:hypothetical protein
MVKAFVPAYDSSTNYNVRLANHIFPSGVNIIQGESATRKSLQNLILSSDTTALFLMSHGDNDCVCAQGGEAAINIDDVKNNTGNILRLNIFAWVCKTSLGLGPAFHQRAKIKKGTWWGYRTTISAPSPREMGAFQKILGYIVDEFPGVNTVSSGKTFISGLKDICELHRDKLVLQMSRSRCYDDAHETAVAFRELWEHLEGWLPIDPQPVHSGMIDPILEHI